MGTPCPTAAPVAPETARIGRRHVCLHDLCHTWACLLLAQATMNTYSHVLPSLQREAADRMNDLVA